ncbi:MAG: dTDP-4-dehydrorhamnose 3,5-epimerase [Planctomycetota bacterium]|jgi:dTDP-4-dehydrorhamnose 3,5-epimerase|nr:dTDP-4-dehydrorhamnose 3,5-epimerase [Planctomycetota bacterium]
MLNVTTFAIPGLLLLEPKVFGDNRGFFIESWNQKTFNEVVGRKVEFVQDNHSGSAKNVLRGMHYQVKTPQAKLVRVSVGSIYDVTVDLRPDSPAFGQWVGVELSAENKRQLWLPEGVAHGFLALSDWVETLYKTNSYYAPDNERTLIWNDPHLAINWPLNGAQPIVSEKDCQGLSWNEHQAD